MVAGVTDLGWAGLGWYGGVHACTPACSRLRGPQGHALPMRYMMPHACTAAHPCMPIHAQRDAVPACLPACCVDALAANCADAAARGEDERVSSFSRDIGEVEDYCISTYLDPDVPINEVRGDHMVCGINCRAMHGHPAEHTVHASTHPISHGTM